MILREDILFIIFMVLLFIVFYKWCVPVLKEEVIQAKKRTEKLDLEIEKINKEISVLNLIQDILLFDDIYDFEDFEDYE